MKSENSEKAYRIVMTICIIWIVLAPSIIWLYLDANTHIDELVIEGHDIYGGLYHVRTDGPTLNVSTYYRDILLKGEKYEIKWVDGVKIDRILKYELIPCPVCPN